MSRLDELDAKALEAARIAYLKAEENPNMVECPKCNGRGYHHGFGEDGADPDWCTQCGGGQYDLAEGEQDRPLDEAIRAYLDATRIRSSLSLEEGEKPTDGPEEIEIDRLGLAAFQTNSNEDKAAYYLAASKWFQDRHSRTNR